MGRAHCDLRREAAAREVLRAERRRRVLREDADDPAHDGLRDVQPTPPAKRPTPPPKRATTPR